MPKIIKCEDMFDPPVGMADVSMDLSGFNVHIETMLIDQVYSFQYDLDTPLYIKLTKDRTLMYFTKKPNNKRTD